jgi:hypothetical protein
VLSIEHVSGYLRENLKGFNLKQKYYLYSFLPPATSKKKRMEYILFLNFSTFEKHDFDKIWK